MKVDLTQKQYIDFGDLRNQSCIVIPQLCTEGGTVMLWVKDAMNTVSASDGGDAIAFVSSKAGDARPGFDIIYTDISGDGYYWYALCIQIGNG